MSGATGRISCSEDLTQTLFIFSELFHVNNNMLNCITNNNVLYSKNKNGFCISSEYSEELLHVARLAPKRRVGRYRYTGLRPVLPAVPMATTLFNMTSSSTLIDISFLHFVLQ